MRGMMPPIELLMWHRARWALALAVLLLPLQLRAQDSAPVVLRLNPRVGDTLHTRLEQQTEVSATTTNAAGSARGVTTSVTIHSRTIVRSVQQASTTVLTIVDSAVMTSTDAHAASMIADAQRTLQGQQLVLQLAADGTVERAQDARGAVLPREVADAISAMPAVFPRKPVSVGEQWVREMPLPAGGPLGARGSGHARAVFRLDSLRRGGAIAYVSMRGEILPDSTSRGGGVQLSGSIAGTMQVDRARGWMTDSRFVVMLKSLIVPPAASGLAPMRFITKVTQRLRTMDKR
jgi:hypothetical protein